jgi:hypothetical protein
MRNLILMILDFPTSLCLLSSEDLALTFNCRMLFRYNIKVVDKGNFWFPLDTEEWPKGESTRSISFVPKYGLHWTDWLFNWDQHKGAPSENLFLSVRSIQLWQEAASTWVFAYSSWTPVSFLPNPIHELHYQGGNWDRAPSE